MYICWCHYSRSLLFLFLFCDVCSILVAIRVAFRCYLVVMLSQHACIPSNDFGTLRKVISMLGSRAVCLFKFDATPKIYYPTTCFLLQVLGLFYKNYGAFTQPHSFLLTALYHEDPSSCFRCPSWGISRSCFKYPSCSYTPQTPKQCFGCFFFLVFLVFLVYYLHTVCPIFTCELSSKYIS